MHSFVGDIHICEVRIEQTNPCWHLGIRTNIWRNGVFFVFLVTAASGNDIDVCFKWDVLSTFGLLVVQKKKKNQRSSSISYK